MSAEQKKTPTVHTLDNLSRLSILYIRNALRSPDWITNGLDDYAAGCDALRALPAVALPLECKDDDSVLGWANAMSWPPFEIDDAVRDTCRKALKHAFREKRLPLNDHAAVLITLFSLRS
jgi:hypothetical protein